MDTADLPRRAASPPRTLVLGVAVMTVPEARAPRSLWHKRQRPKFLKCANAGENEQRSAAHSMPPFPVVEFFAPLIRSHNMIAGSPSVNGMFAIRLTASS